MPEALHWTENDEANRLLAADPLALLIGMLLDQQFPMERAFLGPHVLAGRMGGVLDLDAIIETPEEDLVKLFQGPPAVHRFPGSMAIRTQAMCRHIADSHDGDAASIWTEAADGGDLLKRLKALPGYGDAKARVFVGILGKRFEAAPPGWEEAAADWASIADVVSFDDVSELRMRKREAKAKKKS